MGYFFIDESIHDHAEFIIAACVYTESIVDDKIADCIKSCGFDPDLVEFKSGTNYFREPDKAKIRELLLSILVEECKLGIVIIPKEKRSELGCECLKAIKQFIDNNECITAPISIYFDQEIIKKSKRVEPLIESLALTDCAFHFEQDSKIVKGIQLADLASHTASIQLKDGLGLIQKKVKAGENSGYDPDLEIELGFVMWATLRYTFFNSRFSMFSGDPIKDATLDVEPYGLYISELCDETLKEAAKRKFSTVYLGCIH